MYSYVLVPSEFKGFSPVELKLVSCEPPNMGVGTNSGPVEEQISFLTAEQTLVLRQRLLLLSIPVTGAALH